TAAARGAAAIEYRKHFLKGSRDAVAVEVVGERRAAALDRVAQDGARCASDGGELEAGQAMAAPRRPYARAKQDLVRVDVADSGNHALIEERSLDVTARTPQLQPQRFATE